MRSLGPAVLALLALIACDKRREIVLRINAAPEGPVRAYLYSGEIAGCGDPRNRLFTDGQPPSGYVIELADATAGFESPDLSAGVFSVVAAAVSACDLVAVGCTTFSLPENDSIDVDMREHTPRAQWCGDMCNCGAVSSDGGRPDECDMLGTGAPCLPPGGEPRRGVCCPSVVPLTCIAARDCPCDDRPDNTDCEDERGVGTCLDGVCNVASSDLFCAPPLNDLGDMCELAMVLGGIPVTPGAVVDVVWYQVDRGLRVPSYVNGTPSSPTGMGNWTFYLRTTPTEEVQVCTRDRMACRPDFCPCDDPTQPRLAFGALGLGDNVTGQLSLPVTGLVDELLIVWASHDFPEGEIGAANPALRNLGFGVDVVFGADIPLGYSLWRGATGAGGMLRFDPWSGELSGDITQCMACTFPLPRR